MEERRSSLLYWLFGAAACVALLGLFLLEDSSNNDSSSDTLEDDRNSEVTGSVVDSAGNPVQSFCLTITETAKNHPPLSLPITNKRGLFAFSLRPGDYTFSCTAKSYQPYTEVLTVLSGSAIRMEVKLDHTSPKNTPRNPPDA